MTMRWFVTIGVAVGVGVSILWSAGRAEPIKAQPIADRSDHSAITLAETDNLCRPPLTQLFTPITHAPAAPPPNLFSDRPSAGQVDAPGDPKVLRARSVDVQLDRLNQQPGSQLTLNLFDDTTFVTILDRVESNSPGIHSWIGHLSGIPDGEAIFVVNGNVLIGNITLPGALYEVRYTGTAHVVYQIDPLAFPPEAEPIPVEMDAATFSQPPAAPADSCDSIDVMVVYTADARNAAGGTAAMQALIALAVTETNLGYSHSAVAQRINLVHAEEVSYSEAGFDWTTTLERLTGTSDGYMDNVHSLRNTYHADETVLLVADTGYCGLAWLMTSVSPSFESNAFAVVAQSCATGYYSFAHEMGHNMGSHHDRANAGGPAAYSYSYGYQAPDQSFRTVMAYNCASPGCPRINYWSNPAVSYNGQPTGILYTAPDSADNHRSLNNTACTVANWRTRTTAPAAPAGLSAAPISAKRIDLSWTDNSTNETGFKIERSPNGSTGWTQIATVGAGVESYPDDNLNCNTPYYYRVRAYNASGDSAYSNMANAATSQCPAVCTAARTLQCGATDNWSNASSGSTDQVDSYSCSSWNESGPEYTYVFTPNMTGRVNVSLTNLTADLDIFVADDRGGGCLSDGCLAYGDLSAGFVGVKDHTYYLVVDGYNGLTSTYTIDVTCTPFPHSIDLPLILRGSAAADLFIAGGLPPQAVMPEVSKPRESGR